jgi:hypothetical protein
MRSLAIAISILATIGVASFLVFWQIEACIDEADGLVNFSKLTCEVPAGATFKPYIQRPGFILSSIVALAACWLPVLLVPKTWPEA